MQKRISKDGFKNNFMQFLENSDFINVDDKTLKDYIAFYH